MKQQIWLQCRAAESENRGCTKNLWALLDDRNFDETEAVHVVAWQPEQRAYYPPITPTPEWTILDGGGSSTRAMKRTSWSPRHRGVAKGATKETSFGYTDGPEAATHMDNHVTSYFGDCEGGCSLQLPSLLSPTP